MRAAAAPSTTKVADAVLTASRALVGVAARSLAGRVEDITMPQFRALVVLAEGGPLRPVDLASALGTSSSTVTRLCDRLVKKDLIARRRTEEDRREVQLELTRAGRRLLDEVTAARRADIVGILDKVAPGRRAEIASALQLFSEAAGEIPERTWGEVWEL